MNAPSKIPAYRIEVKDAKKQVWWPIEFAYTETQRDAKLERRLKEYGEELARAVDNGSTADRKLFIEFVDVAALNLLRNLQDFVKSEKLAEKFSEVYGVDLAKIPTPDEMLTHFGRMLDGELPPGFPEPVVADAPASTAALVGEPAPAIVATADGGAQLVKVDALAGVTPLPFEEGDVIQDVHTKAHIRVTKIHAADGSGRGFDWENLDPDSPDKIGTCPINAIGNFEPLPDKPKKKKSS